MNDDTRTVISLACEKLWRDANATAVFVVDARTGFLVARAMDAERVAEAAVEAMRGRVLAWLRAPAPPPADPHDAPNLHVERVGDRALVAVFKQERRRH